MCYNISTTRTLDVKSVANQLNNITILTSPMLAKVCCASGILQLTSRCGVSYCLKGYQKMTTNYIYGLVDPRTDELRYVGKSNDPVRRTYNHITDAKKKFTYRDRWIKQLLDLGLKPKLEILEDGIKDKDWNEIERWWIFMAKACGHRLTNGTEGGTGFGSGVNHYGYGKKYPDSHRENMSRVKMGSNNPMYGKVGGNRGKKFSESYRKKLSISHMGIIPSEETREKRRLTMLGERNPQFGKVRSEEYRKKLSEGHKGIRPSDKQKKKQSLTVSMTLALKRGNIERVYLLQGQYLELFGEYSRKHPTP